VVAGPAHRMDASLKPHVRQLLKTCRAIEARNRA
jgi:hypothetical protein